MCRDHSHAGLPNLHAFGTYSLDGVLVFAGLLRLVPLILNSIQEHIVITYSILFYSAARPTILFLNSGLGPTIQALFMNSILFGNLLGGGALPKEAALATPS